MSKELSSSKETILNYIKTSLKLVRLENYENDGLITGTDTSNALCWSLESVFLHSLKNTKNNFWPFLKLILHKSALKEVSSLSQINSDIGRSRAWLRVSLNEGSLDSYLNSIINDNHLLNKFYHPSAFLLQPHCSNQLFNILKDLSSLNFHLSTNASLLNKWNNTPLQLATHPPSPNLKWPTLLNHSNSEESSPHTSQTLSFTLRIPKTIPNSSNTQSLLQKSPINSPTLSKNPTHPVNYSLQSHGNLQHPPNHFQSLHAGFSPSKKHYTPKISTFESPSSSYSNRDSIGIPANKKTPKRDDLKGDLKSTKLDSNSKSTKVDLNKSSAIRNDSDSGSLISRPDFQDAQMSVYQTVYIDSEDAKRGGSGKSGGSCGVSGSSTKGSGSGKEGTVEGSDGRTKQQGQQSKDITQQNNNPNATHISYKPLQHFITKPKHIKTTPTSHTHASFSLKNYSQLSPSQQLQQHSPLQTFNKLYHTQHSSFSDAGMVRRMDNGISLSDDLKFRLIVKDNLDRFPLTIPQQQLNKPSNAQQQQEKNLQQFKSTHQFPTQQHPTQPLLQHTIQQEGKSNSDFEILKKNINEKQGRTEMDEKTKNYESFRDFLESYTKEDPTTSTIPTTETTPSFTTSPHPYTSPTPIPSTTNPHHPTIGTSTNPFTTTNHIIHHSPTKTSITTTINPNPTTTTNLTTTATTVATTTTTIAPTTASDTTVRSMSVNDMIESLKLKRHKLQDDETSTDPYTDIQREKGLASQAFRCHVCSAPIGVSFSQERVCAFNKKYHCDDCMGALHHYLPCKIIYNWDFNTYNVSNDSHKNLLSRQSHPIINIDLLNPSLYQHISKLHDVKVLRERVRCLKSYLVTCQSHLMEHYLQLLGNKPYFYENIHLYSLADLLKVPSGQLGKILLAAVNYAANHVYACVLCSQKGFICEICRQDKIIYPFDDVGTARCEVCHSLFHRSCKSNQSDCPKCKRMQTRNQSRKTSTSNNIRELLNSQSSLDAQINYSFTDSNNSNDGEKPESNKNIDYENNNNKNIDYENNNNKNVDFYIEYSSDSTNQSLISPIS